MNNLCLVLVLFLDCESKTEVAQNHLKIMHFHGFSPKSFSLKERKMESSQSKCICLASLLSTYP